MRDLLANYRSCSPTIAGYRAFMSILFFFGGIIGANATNDFGMLQLVEDSNICNFVGFLLIASFVQLIFTGIDLTQDLGVSPTFSGLFSLLLFVILTVAAGIPGITATLVASGVVIILAASIAVLNICNYIKKRGRDNG